MTLKASFDRAFYQKVHDQAFSKETLEKVLRKSDFKANSANGQAVPRDQLLHNALEAAESWHAGSPPLLIGSPLKGKTVYRLVRKEDILVERKLRMHLEWCSSITRRDRSQIVTILKRLLEEGVPYRIYRLDIRSCFESFNQDHVLSTVDSIKTLSPTSKRLIHALLRAHREVGGRGIPRGLSISAVLIEILMQDFDQKVRAEKEVFFFARYVDDIVVVTSGEEEMEDFLDNLGKWLPPNLEMNPTKQEVCAFTTRNKIGNNHPTLQFSYLGYRFNVSSPPEQNGQSGVPPRIVHLDMANSTIRRIKTRIVRSFLSFQKNRDLDLLHDRLAFLTQNYRIYDHSSGVTRFAGIFFNRPLLSNHSDGLSELDSFLRYAILSRKDRVFSKTHAMTSAPQKRRLLTFNFTKGYEKRIFTHFSASRIRRIKHCWTY